MPLELEDLFGFLTLLIRFPPHLLPTGYYLNHFDFVCPQHGRTDLCEPFQRLFMGMSITISLTGRDYHVLWFNSVQEDFAIGRASTVMAGFVDDGRQRYCILSKCNVSQVVNLSRFMSPDAI
jgi:hypothetical protein